MQACSRCEAIPRPWYSGSTLTNLARHLGIAPEDAMRAANGRFTTRFHVVERGLEAQGVPFGEASLEQMNTLWDQAKAEEKARLPPSPASGSGSG